VLGLFCGFAGDVLDLVEQTHRLPPDADRVRSWTGGAERSGVRCHPAGSRLTTAA
jgi:hypothetical protein